MDKSSQSITPVSTIQCLSLSLFALYLAIGTALSTNQKRLPSPFAEGREFFSINFQWDLFTSPRPVKSILAQAYGEIPGTPSTFISPSPLKAFQGVDRERSFYLGLVYDMANPRVTSFMKRWCKKNSPSEIHTATLVVASRSGWGANRPTWSKQVYDCR